MVGGTVLNGVSSASEAVLANKRKGKEPLVSIRNFKSKTDETESRHCFDNQKLNSEYPREELDSNLFFYLHEFRRVCSGVTRSCIDYISNRLLLSSLFGFVENVLGSSATRALNVILQSVSLSVGWLKEGATPRNIIYSLTRLLAALASVITVESAIFKALESLNSLFSLYAETSDETFEREVAWLLFGMTAVFIKFALLDQTTAEKPKTWLGQKTLDGARFTFDLKAFVDTLKQVVSIVEQRAGFSRDDHSSAPKDREIGQMWRQAARYAREMNRTKELIQIRDALQDTDIAKKSESVDVQVKKVYEQLELFIKSADSSNILTSSHSSGRSGFLSFPVANAEHINSNIHLTEIQEKLGTLADLIARSEHENNDQRIMELKDELSNLKVEIPRNLDALQDFGYLKNSYYSHDSDESSKRINGDDVLQQSALDNLKGDQTFEDALDNVPEGEDVFYDAQEHVSDNDNLTSEKLNDHESAMQIEKGLVRSKRSLSSPPEEYVEITPALMVDYHVKTVYEEILREQQQHTPRRYNGELFIIKKLLREQWQLKKRLISKSLDPDIETLRNQEKTLKREYEVEIETRRSELSCLMQKETFGDSVTKAQERVIRRQMKNLKAQYKKRIENIKASIDAIERERVSSLRITIGQITELRKRKKELKRNHKQIVRNARSNIINLKLEQFIKQKLNATLSDTGFKVDDKTYIIIKITDAKTSETKYASHRLIDIAAGSEPKEEHDTATVVTYYWPRGVSREAISQIMYLPSVVKYKEVSLKNDYERQALGFISEHLEFFVTEWTEACETESFTSSLLSDSRLNEKFNAMLSEIKATTRQNTTQQERTVDRATKLEEKHMLKLVSQSKADYNERRTFQIPENDDMSRFYQYVKNIISERHLFSPDTKIIAKVGDFNIVTSLISVATGRVMSEIPQSIQENQRSLIRPLWPETAGSETISDLSTMMKAAVGYTDADSVKGVSKKIAESLFNQVAHSLQTEAARNGVLYVITKQALFERAISFCDEKIDQLAAPESYGDLQAIVYKVFAYTSARRELVKRQIQYNSHLAENEASVLGERYTTADVYHELRLNIDDIVMNDLNLTDDQKKKINADSIIFLKKINSDENVLGSCSILDYVIGRCKESDDIELVWQSCFPPSLINSLVELRACVDVTKLLLETSTLIQDAKEIVDSRMFTPEEYLEHFCDIRLTNCDLTDVVEVVTHKLVPVAREIDQQRNSGREKRYVGAFGVHGQMQVQKVVRNCTVADLLLKREPSLSDLEGANYTFPSKYTEQEKRIIFSTDIQTEYDIYTENLKKDHVFKSNMEILISSILNYKGLRFGVTNGTFHEVKLGRFLEPFNMAGAVVARVPPVSGGLYYAPPGSDYSESRLTGSEALRGIMGGFSEPDEMLGLFMVQVDGKMHFFSTMNNDEWTFPAGDFDQVVLSLQNDTDFRDWVFLHLGRRKLELYDNLDKLGSLDNLGFKYVESSVHDISRTYTHRILTRNNDDMDLVARSFPEIRLNKAMKVLRILEIPLSVLTGAFVATLPARVAFIGYLLDIMIATAPSLIMALNADSSENKKKYLVEASMGLLFEAIFTGGGLASVSLAKFSAKRIQEIKKALYKKVRLTKKEILEDVLIEPSLTPITEDSKIVLRKVADNERVRQVINDPSLDPLPAASKIFTKLKSHGNSFQEVGIKAFFIWENPSVNQPIKNLVVTFRQNDNLFAIDVAGSKFGSNGDRFGSFKIMPFSNLKKIYAKTFGENGMLVKYVDLKSPEAYKSTFFNEVDGELLPKEISVNDVNFEFTRLSEPLWYEKIETFLLNQAGLDAMSEQDIANFHVRNGLPEYRKIDETQRWIRLFESYPEIHQQKNQIKRDLRQYVAPFENTGQAFEMRKYDHFYEQVPEICEVLRNKGYNVKVRHLEILNNHLIKNPINHMVLLVSKNALDAISSNQFVVDLAVGRFSKYGMGIKPLILSELNWANLYKNVMGENSNFVLYRDYDALADIPLFQASGSAQQGVRQTSTFIDGDEFGDAFKRRRFGDLAIPVEELSNPKAALTSPSWYRDASVNLGELRHHERYTVHLGLGREPIQFIPPSSPLVEDVAVLTNIEAKIKGLLDNQSKGNFYDLSLAKDVAQPISDIRFVFETLKRSGQFTDVHILVNEVWFDVTKNTLVRNFFVAFEFMGKKYVLEPSVALNLMKEYNPFVITKDRWIVESITGKTIDHQINSVDVLTDVIDTNRLVKTSRRDSVNSLFSVENIAEYMNQQRGLYSLTMGKRKNPFEYNPYATILHAPSIYSQIVYRSQALPLPPCCDTRVILSDYNPLGQNFFSQDLGSAFRIYKTDSPIPSEVLVIDASVHFKLNERYKKILIGGKVVNFIDPKKQTLEAVFDPLVHNQDVLHQNIIDSGNGVVFQASKAVGNYETQPYVSEEVKQKIYAIINSQYPKVEESLTEDQAKTLYELIKNRLLVEQGLPISQADIMKIRKLPNGKSITLQDILAVIKREKIPYKYINVIVSEPHEKALKKVMFEMKPSGVLFVGSLIPINTVYLGTWDLDNQPVLDNESTSNPYLK